MMPQIMVAGRQKKFILKRLVQSQKSPADIPGASTMLTPPPCIGDCGTVQKFCKNLSVLYETLFVYELGKGDHSLHLVVQTLGRAV